MKLGINISGLKRKMYRFQFKATTWKSLMICVRKRWTSRWWVMTLKVRPWQEEPTNKTKCMRQGLRISWPRTCLCHHSRTKRATITTPHHSHKPRKLNSSKPAHTVNSPNNNTQKIVNSKLTNTSTKSSPNPKLISSLTNSTIWSPKKWTNPWLAMTLLKNGANIISNKPTSSRINTLPKTFRKLHILSLNSLILINSMTKLTENCQLLKSINQNKTLKARTLMSSMTWNQNRWMPPWSVTTQNLLIPGKNTKIKTKILLPKVNKINNFMKNLNLAKILLKPMKIENILKVHTKTKPPLRKKSHNTLRINMIWHLHKNTNNLSRFSIMSICLNRLLNKLKVLMKNRRKNTTFQGMMSNSK